MTLRDAARVAVLGAAGLLLVACSAQTAPVSGPTATPPPEPPAPPAACLLDASALGTSTGVTWTVDESTASDLRCVYDPAGAADDVFVVVDVVEDGTAVDVVAEVCVVGSRTPTGTGFGCRLATGGVFAARTDGERLITVAVTQLPAGTTPEQLDAAITGQLDQVS